MPRTVITALVAACAVLVPAQLAHAQDIDIPIPKPPKTALFKAKAHGSQVTSWNLLVPDDPFDPCDSSQTGHGTQDASLDFADCPWWVGGPTDGPSDYETLGAGAAVKRSVLRNPKRKVIKLSGQYEKPYKGHGFTGRTVVKWSLTLRRVTKIKAPV